MRVDASGRGEREQDFRLLIGSEPFDPIEAAGRAPAAAMDAAAGAQATIVQFAAPLTHPDAVRLQREYDLALDRYVPNLAYIEQLSPATLDRVRRDFHVRACIPLVPELKLDPSIAEAPRPPLEFDATLFGDADPGAVASALAARGARDILIVDDRQIGGRAHARFAADDLTLLTEIAGAGDIAWIEAVPESVDSNVEAAQTIQSGTIGAARGSPIWDHQLHGEQQVINVIDSGPIDIAHCFFADAEPNRAGPGHRKVRAMSSESSTQPAVHATQVAGILAGDQRGNSGAHPHRGGAWAAKLVVNNRHDMKRPHSRSLLHLLDRGKSAGAFIHSNSWHNQQTGTSGNYDTTARQVDDFSWRNESHLVIASGANTLEQDPADPPGHLSPGVNSPPGTAKNTLCVAAAKAFPSEMERGSGCDGPTFDNRRKPEIMAVGCGIEVATVGTTCGTPLKGGCHTSFATPHAAAAAALVRQYFTEGWYPEGKLRKGEGERRLNFGFTPSGALIKAVLLNSTVDMTGEKDRPDLPTAERNRYPSNAEGWGLIRLNRALYFEGGSRRLVVTDIPRTIGLSTFEQRTYSFEVVGSAEQLKITLVWMDPPPSEHGFRKPTQNLIEFDVEDPGGKKFMANNFAFGVSEAGKATRDVVNNVQMVIVDTPAVGKWTIKLGIDGNAAWFTRQGYALVASGSLKSKLPFL